MELIDIGCNLAHDSFDADRTEVLERAREADVVQMVVTGASEDGSLAAMELARAHPGELFATCGVHPHHASDFTVETENLMQQLAIHDEVRAVGETGLDWFKEFSPRERQLEGFLWHLDLARRLDKPVVIHCRDAHEDTVRCVRQFPGVRGVMHCYTFGPDELAPYLEAGLYISFSGVVTYPKNDANRAAAAIVPEDRLLVETDCPFLAPQGHRGKRNEPALVRTVLERVAEVRGAGLEELARATSANAARLFGLSPLVDVPSPGGGSAR